VEEKAQMKSQSTNFFSKYLAAKRIHPCLILVSPEEETLKAASLQLAKTLFCKSSADLSCGSFCDHCSSCQRIEKGIYPDLIWLSSEEEDEALKVENIREIIYQREVAPLEGIVKVCVIKKAHQMNAACSNALLKTTEEPKAGRNFVLLTSQLGNLLPNLHSRSLHLHFKPQSASGSFSKEEWAEWENQVRQYFESQDPEFLTELGKDKGKALRLLQFLQTAMHRKVCQEEGVAFLASYPEKDCDRKTQKLLDLESKLRSNANFGLLFQSFLQEEFHR